MKDKNKWDWKPIETIPKTGEELLVCNINQGGVKRLISWSKVHRRWREKGSNLIYLQDTHWTYIPPISNG